MGGILLLSEYFFRIPIPSKSETVLNIINLKEFTTLEELKLNIFIYF